MRSHFLINIMRDCIILKPVSLNSTFDHYIKKCSSRCSGYVPVKYSTGLSTNDPSEKTKKEFFVQLSCASSFKHDSKKLRNIVQSHVSPSNDNTEISVTSFYKPFKMSALFTTRQLKPVSERSNVVYKFECPEANCNASYIGYTTNTLGIRSKQHRYFPSSVKSHLTFDHDAHSPPADKIIECFKIMHSYQEVVDLKIAEAIEIKSKNPFINVKYNELYNLLNLY